MNLNPEVLYVLRECDGLLSEVWINTVQHSEELICNTFRRPKISQEISQVATTQNFPRVQFLLFPKNYCFWYLDKT